MYLHIYIYIYLDTYKDIFVHMCIFIISIVDVYFHKDALMIQLHVRFREHA